MTPSPTLLMNVDDRSQRKLVPSLAGATVSMTRAGRDRTGGRIATLITPVGLTRPRGRADGIRQALAAGYVDELSVSIAPVVLGGGKRLFEGFTKSLDVMHVRTLQSPFATHIIYRVVR